MPNEYEESILRSIRRIIRAVDSQSRFLANNFGITGPQLVCLRMLARRGEMTLSSLAKEVSLSQGTITGIVDRLASRNLITKKRSEKDRRAILAAIAPEGREIISRSPSFLQDRFIGRLTSLPQQNQVVINAVLDQVVVMMGAEDVDAAPVLTTGPSTVTATEVKKFLDNGQENPQQPPPVNGQPSRPNNDNEK